MEERRALISIGVVYQTSLEKLKNIPKMVQEIIENLEAGLEAFREVRNSFNE